LNLGVVSWPIVGLANIFAEAVPVSETHAFLPFSALLAMVVANFPC
jgi:hypothetical protein